GLGSGTPPNGTTDSESPNRAATTFGIDGWPVAAVKAYVGHSLAPASADQLIAALGSFKYGLIPGIKTIDRVADDVHQDHLQISTADVARDQQTLDVCFLNSKGFGGNNATGYVLAPHVAERMLRKRHGEAAFNDYLARREQTRANAQAYEERALQGDFDVIYNFGLDMIHDQDLLITDQLIQVPGFAQPVTYQQ